MSEWYGRWEQPDIRGRRGAEGDGTPAVCLPTDAAVRWAPRRKAELVAAVNSGQLTLEEACLRYSLSVEEFLSWQRALQRDGYSGLKVTRLQRHRQRK